MQDFEFAEFLFLFCNVKTVWVLLGKKTHHPMLEISDLPNFEFHAVYIA
jgi:hypothetical protein